jgi:ATP-dependent Clp protease ATP-binding subunit ClpX
MNSPSVACSFCGTPKSNATPLIAGTDGHICEDCVRLAHQVVSSWGRKKALVELHGPLPKPMVLKSRLDQYVIDQDDAKEILSVAVYNHYKRLRNASAEAMEVCQNHEVELGKSNILLLGPSGSGKTLLASTLARLVGVPFVIADATTLTQAGYVGEDVESVLAHLLDAAEGNVASAEWGIVYIDEIDKLARSPESPMGIRDISGEGVQQALLKLVEGSQVKVPAKGRRRSEGNNADTMIDTSNIMFIVGGAFAGLEEVISKRLSPKREGIGFHTAPNPPQRPSATEIARSVEPEDLRRFGMIPEFIGRFPVIAALEPLSETALLRILTEPRNALVSQYRTLFAYDNIKLEFTPEALLAIARLAQQRGTGARGLRGILENILRRTMYEAPSRNDIVRCMVDEDAVNGVGEIQLITNDLVPDADLEPEAALQAQATG